MKYSRLCTYIFVFLAVVFLAGCSGRDYNPVDISPLPPSGSGIAAWITNPDRSSELEKQSGFIPFTGKDASLPTIVIDTAKTFQVMDGFGFSLTGGSAWLINHLPESQKAALLQELFGNGEKSVGISYLRISIGASDLSREVFSYNDLPPGETDPEITKFSLSNDTADLIPVLREILKINPDIKIMGSPWSAPVWMKDNGNSVGGSLMPQYHGAYAKYFVKYIQAMKSNGITIDAITPQNEPQHGGNNPSMVMSSSQQAEFIRDHLGPAFRDAGITTRIVIWDHNCDNPGYPISVLNDNAAKGFIDGTAFHLYSGSITALTTVHDAHPDKNLYFTEQWTGANGSFSGDLNWHIKNVVIGSVRNWSKVVLEWNLASDANYDPHTPGGCDQCKGALTIDGTGISRNVSYYIIGHASRFVTPGSVRIESNSPHPVINVAFRRPDGRKVIIALNDSKTPVMFSIKYGDKYARILLGPGSVGTYVW